MSTGGDVWGMCGGCVGTHLAWPGKRGEVAHLQRLTLIMTCGLSRFVRDRVKVCVELRVLVRDTLEELSDTVPSSSSSSSSSSSLRRTSAPCFGLARP